MTVITRMIKFLRVGVGISNTDVEYADSTSNSIAPTSGWQTYAPAWQNGHYIWTRTHIYYTDGNEKLSEPVCLPSGKGIAKIEEWYYLSSSTTSLVGGTWVKDKSPTWKDGYYIWTKSVITYTDGSSTTTSPICTAGSKGDKGEQGQPGEDGKDGMDGVDGEDGNGIKSQTSLFVASNRSTGVTHDNTTGWQSAFIAPTQQKPYIWKCVETIYTKTGTTYSTAELVAVWQSGANANLLDNAAFTDDTNMRAWENISEYAAADGQAAPNSEIGRVDKTETVEGRNSFFDTCKYSGDRIKFKEVLRQVVHNRMAGKPLKLAGSTWYTFSFWAKGWQQTISVNQTSSAYGFARKDLYLIAGRTYKISAYGYIDAAAQSEGKTLTIYVYKDNWGELKSMKITKTSYELKTMEFTPQTTGVYHLEAYMYDDTRPSAGSVYLSWYKVEDNCDLNTYIYPSVVDTDTKVFIDGVETRPDPDLGVTWKLGSSWTKHTVSFKTKSTLAYADIQGVLFRLMPTPCEEAYRNIYICMPKLEVGMMATGFIDNGSDTKGERGKYMRGPQDWDSLPDGTTFYPLENNEVAFFDTVEYKGKYYECCKKHTKNSAVTPLADYESNGGNGNWKVSVQFSMVAAKVLWSLIGQIDFFGSQRISVRSSTTSQRVEIENGLIKIFGTVNNIQPNIQFGTDETGASVLSYYDNDGNFLYNLGPSGLDASGMTSAKIESVRVAKVSDVTCETPFSTSKKYGDTSYEVCCNNSVQENLFGTSALVENSGETQVGYKPVKDRMVTIQTLYRYTAARINNTYAADSARGLTAELAGKANGKFFTSSTKLGENGQLVNLASGEYIKEYESVMMSLRYAPSTASLPKYRIRIYKYTLGMSVARFVYSLIESKGGNQTIIN